jgi:hypothetical protein
MGSDPAAEADSCCDIRVGSSLVVSLGFLERDRYPYIMYAVTVAEKRLF